MYIYICIYIYIHIYIYTYKREREREREMHTQLTRKAPPQYEYVRTYTALTYKASTAATHVTTSAEHVLSNLPLCPLCMQVKVSEG